MKENDVLNFFENEVTILDCLIENDKDIIVNCDTEDDEFDYDKELAELSLKDYYERKELFETAISALKEVQHYREIGTVEEIKQAIGVLSLSENDIIETFHELNEYRKIGTVEECRESAEKQEAKNIIRIAGRYPYKCPTCNGKLEIGYKHCIVCGQLLRYPYKNLEGMEE